MPIRKRVQSEATGKIHTIEFDEEPSDEIIQAAVDEADAPFLSSKQEAPSPIDEREAQIAEVQKQAKESSQANIVPMALGSLWDLGKTVGKGVYAEGKARADLPKDVLLNLARGDIKGVGKAIVKDPATGIEAGGRAGQDLVNVGVQAYQKAKDEPQEAVKLAALGAYTSPLIALMHSMRSRDLSKEDAEKLLERQEFAQNVQKEREEGVIKPLRGLADKESAELRSLLIDPEAIGVTTGGKMALKTALKTPNKSELVVKHGAKYREILAPGKEEIKRVEIKAGRDIDKSYQLAAEEGLVIDKTPDNKLTTEAARAQLKTRMNDVSDELDAAIASKEEKVFDLEEIRRETKKDLRNLFDNDDDYEGAVKQLDNEIDAAIRNRGGAKVDGVTANKIKKGMWSKSYNQMAPNANKVARQIGHNIKEAIEKVYDEDDIKGLNQKLGDYATLNKLLENAEGRVVAKGKIGRYVAQGIGAMAGRSAGALAGVPVGGELAGAYVGGQVSDVLVNPRRLTDKMRKKMLKAKGNAPAKTATSKVSKSKAVKPPPLPEDYKFEVMARQLANKAKMQRLADQIKEKTLRENALQDASKIELPEGEVTRGSSPVDIQGSEGLVYEKKAEELAKRAQQQRVADAIKEDELRKQGIKEEPPRSTAEADKLEYLAMELAERAKKQRLADAIKAQELKRLYNEARANLINQSGLQLKPPTKAKVQPRLGKPLVLPEGEFGELLKRLKPEEAERLLREYSDQLGY